MIHNKADEGATHLPQESRDILLHAPIGFFTSTPEGNFLDVNPAMARMFGYESPRDMIDSIKNIATQLYVNPGDRDEFIRLLETQGELLNHEIRFRRKDGSIIWTSRNARAVRDSAGTILFYQGFVTDITRQKQTEQALGEAKNLFEGILDGVVDVIGIQNTDHTIVRYNRAGYRMLGLAPEDVAGKPCYSLIGRSEPCAMCATSGSLESKQPETVELFVPELDRYLLCRSNPVLDDTGEVILIIEQLQDITDRKKVEEALKKSEEKYRLLFENAPFGMSVVEADGPVTYVNTKFTELFGYHGADVPDGRTWFRKAFPDREYRRKAVTLWKEDTRDAKPGEGMPRIFTVTCSDGTTKVVNIISSLLSSGEYLVSYEDITERTKAEETLRESEKRLDRAMAVKNEGVWDWNLITNETFFDDRYYTMAGYMPREFPQDIAAWREHVHPEDLPEVQSAIATSVSGRSPVLDIEFRFRRQDGSWMWIQGRGKIVGWTVDGAPLRMIGTHTDITERKRAEENLRESEERWKFALEGSGDGVWDWHCETGKVYFSPQWKVMLGLREEEPGDTLEEWGRRLHPDDRKRRHDDLQRHFNGETDIYINEHRVHCKDGAYKWILDRGKVIKRRPDGRPLRVIGTHTDLTDRKKTEEEKIELERRLARAQRLESIGTLAGGIAHDFNNLLMGIQGNASLVMMGLDPFHPHYERLRHVEEHVASGADLTKQLLGFSRGGRYDVKPVSINEIVKKSSAMFGRTRKEISLHEKYAIDPCVAEVDRSQMEQVFINLFVNAWHAMPGGGDIFIETEQAVLDTTHAIPSQVEPGRFVKVTVTDTGTGMDKQTRERIFDPFFTTKEMGRGSGLGLASVYGIITGHEGMINVYSEPGHGTTFTLYIPASEKRPVEEKKSAERILFGTETILLVDDETMVLDVSRDMLKSLGYRVYTTGGGQEAVAFYSEKKDEIDLIILDMIMPGMSGSATFDQLRGINPAVKVLLASGYSINSKAHEIMDRGCDGFIQKPFHLERLSRVVREVLDN